jgi:hypothetical protein
MFYGAAGQESEWVERRERQEALERLAELPVEGEEEKKRMAWVELAAMMSLFPQKHFTSAYRSFRRKIKPGV